MLMDKIIYPSPVYGFLGFIARSRKEANPPLEKKILDCAGGGPRPPLGLFYEHGYETWGIDISAKAVKRARAFAEERGMELHIREGDMRCIPFDDESFSYVYEYYSLCHLTKADIAVAIKEMVRVLQSGGVCFLGFMSSDSWPIQGRKTGQGEYRLVESGREVLHSTFGDDEADGFLEGLEVVTKEKRTIWHREQLAKLSEEEWLQWYDEQPMETSQAEWKRLYEERVSRGNYTHLFYVARKPAQEHA